MAFRLVEEAEADLLNIWINLALDIGNVPAADRLIDAINERFLFLSDYPHIGRRRDDLRLGLRSNAVWGHVILYKVEDEGRSFSTFSRAGWIFPIFSEAL